MKKTLIALAALSIPFGYCGYLYQNQEKFIFEIRTLHKEHTFPFSIPYEEFSFLASDKKPTLSAISFKTKKPLKGVVLFLHGSGTNIDEIPETLPRKITDRGYDFYTYDYRGFGKSEGSITEKDLLNDSMTIYTSLVEKYGEENIVLYGRSLGSSLATFIASERHPKHLLLEAPFHSMLDMALLEQPYLPRKALENILAFHLRSDLWVPSVKTNITFAHGDNDEWVPLAEAERLYEKASSTNRNFALFENWGHEHFCDHPQYDILLDSVLV